MDVRQFDFLAAQPSAELKPRDTFCGISKRALALLLVNALFWQPIWAQAEGIVVSNGNGARLDQAGNGVPIVNIATPGANGLSHNQFQDYNVDSRGVILNNVTDRTGNTQLGGIIVGNPNLQGRAAGVILNEVVGGSPSQLRGYTEVAGQAARVIVANPYGVTCNGCGFINTPRVTLTTGKPILDGNRLDRFQVDGGSVTIEGNGLNADNVDQFDIVTRSAKINAELHARQLNIVAGRNDVAADSLAATPRAASPGDAPQLAIDSSALGGMYANTIRLVGTEAGVGVKLAGNLAASAGDIQLDANGQLTLAQAAASGNIALKSQGLDAQGPVYAGGGVNMQSGGDLTVRQSVAARNAITLNATGQLTNAGVIEAGINPDNSRNATGDVSLQGAQLTNRGSVIASRSLSVTTAGTLDNRGGNLVSQGDFQARVTGNLDNRQQGNLYGAGATVLSFNQLLNAKGVLTSGAALTLTGKQVNNDSGQLGSQGNLTATLGSLDQLDGQFISQGQLTLIADRLGNTGNGLVGGKNGLELRVSEIDNRGGEISSQSGSVSLTGESMLNSGGKVIADSVLTANVATLDNSGSGVLSARQWLRVTGVSLANDNGGLVTSGGDVQATLTGSLTNTHGQILAEGTANVTATSLDNSRGVVSSAGQQTLTVTGGAVQNDGGQLVTDGGLSLSSASLDNGAGNPQRQGRRELDHHRSAEQRPERPPDRQ
ncbi:filamentous hemagglutinin family protein [Pseudomonas psychrotolerans]|nr:filamentous hemagglutinin family protein [Pseudomonas psychrotolerans]